MHNKQSISKRIRAFAVSSAVALSALAAPLSANITTASAADTDNYAKLLQYSMYFYDANMCGSQVGETSGMTWRDDCHTGDGVDGGFHDAGDHAIFGLPQGYSASTLGWGYYEFGDVYDQLGLTSHYKTIADYFCTFFKNSTKLSGDTVSSFCYQLADGGTDHAYWGPPETQESQQGKQKEFWTSSTGSDIAAQYAAALAINYLNFGNAEDLTYAKALLKYATSVNSVATEGPTGFYNSEGYKDDVAWAAGWLYLATQDSSYLNTMNSNIPQYIGWVHCWNNVSLGAHCVKAHITGDWSTVNSYLSGKTGSSSYYFQDAWGSCRYNTAMQLCALSATKNSSADYSAWCKGQMAYILGNNPANTCFVVGLFSNSSKYPHHRAASGLVGWDAFNNSGGTFSNGHVLVGALVGGPTDANGSYVDKVTDYQANEVAIDYNAAIVGAAAGLYSIYGTGETVTSIEGVKPFTLTPGTGNEEETTTTTTTTTSDNNETTTTTTTTQDNTSSGSYEIKPNQTIVYSELPENDKMIGWNWSDFGIGAGETVTKVEVNISANGNIGTWQGAFGSSTSVSPDYWTQTEQMAETFYQNTGTITWEIDAATASIIQTQANGLLKFGVWWIDCGTFTIDSVKVYTSGAAVTTTTSTTTTTTTTTTMPEETVIYGDVNGDRKIEIADLILLARYVSQDDALDKSLVNLKNSDMNSDNVYNADDITVLSNQLVGLN